MKNTSSGAVASGRRQLREWGWLLGWSIALSAILIAPYLVAGQHLVWVMDGGLYGYVAQQWLHGASLYVDVWEQKFPVIFIMNALGLLLGGGQAWGIALWAGICVAGFSVFFLRLLRPYSRTARLTALAAIYLWLSAQQVITSVGAFSLIPHLGIQAVIFLEMESQRWGRYAMAAGLCSAALFFARPNQMLSGLVYLALVLWRATGRQRRIAVLKYAGGVLVLALAINLLVLGTGSVWEMWTGVIGYGILHADAAPRIMKVVYLIFGFEQVGETGLLGLGVGVAVWAAACQVAGGRTLPAAVKAASLLFFVELAAGAASGRLFNHYLVPTLPACGMLVAWLVDQIERATAGGTKPPPRWNIGLGVCLCAAACLVFTLKSAHGVWVTSKTPTPGLSLARRLDGMISPSARIWVWESNWHSLPFLLNRPSASRYFSTPEVFRTPATYNMLMPRIMSDLERTPPEMAADCGRGDYPYLFQETAAHLPSRQPASAAWITRDVRGRLEALSAQYRHGFTDEATRCVVYFRR